MGAKKTKKAEISVENPTPVSAETVPEAVPVEKPKGKPGPMPSFTKQLAAEKKVKKQARKPGPMASFIAEDPSRAVRKEVKK